MKPETGQGFRSGLGRAMREVWAILWRGSVLTAATLVVTAKVAEYSGGKDLLIPVCGGPRPFEVIYLARTPEARAELTSGRWPLDFGGTIVDGRAAEARLPGRCLVHARTAPADGTSWTDARLLVWPDPGAPVDPAEIAAFLKDHRRPDGGRLLVPLPAGPAPKKLLRLAIERTLSGEDRDHALRAVVPVLRPDYALDPLQLVDDIVYAEDNFGGVAIDLQGEPWTMSDAEWRQVREQLVPPGFVDRYQAALLRPPVLGWIFAVAVVAAALIRFLRRRRRGRA